MFRHDDGVYETTKLTESGEYEVHFSGEPTREVRDLSSLKPKDYWNLFPHERDLRIRRTLGHAAWSVAALLILFGMLLPWVPLKAERHRGRQLHNQWEVQRAAAAEKKELSDQYSRDFSYLIALQNASPPPLSLILSRLSANTSTEGGIELAIMEDHRFRVQIWTSEPEKLLAGLGGENSISDLESYEEEKREGENFKKLSLSGVINE